LEAGADAWYSVIAGTLPDFAVRLWAAREDAALLGEIHSKADPLWDLFRAHGGIRIMPQITALLGLGVAALPKPLEPLPASVVKQVESALDGLL
jgi:4-hydroxy-tetrahydrodipicolinate synthase